jgi:hypothetical protein
MFHTTLAQLLEQLAHTHGGRGQEGLADDAIANDFFRNAIDCVLGALETGDENIEQLVRQNDNGNNQQRVNQGHIGVKHCIADGRTQRNHEQELDGRELTNGSAAQPTQQQQCVDVYDDSPHDDLKEEEWMLLSDQYALPVENVDALHCSLLRLARPSDLSPDFATLLRDVAFNGSAIPGVPCMGVRIELKRLRGVVAHDEEKPS